jgi:hypothetical protein
MNDRLQTEDKLNLDACLTTRQLHKVVGIGDEYKPQLERIQLPSVKYLDPICATLDLQKLKVGKNFLAIRHTKTPEARDKSYYSTNIINRSTEKIRIDRFATYVRMGKILVLHSITGGFFNRQQFQEWYDLGQSHWIEPGQVVIDPNNHSNFGVYWVYFGTTARGQKFTAGAPWRGAQSWWQLWRSSEH